MSENRIRKINEEIIYLNRSVSRFTQQLNELESLKAGLLTIEGQAKKIQNNDHSLDYLPSNIWEGEHANKIVSEFFSQINRSFDSFSYMLQRFIASVEAEIDSCQLRQRSFMDEITSLNLAKQKLSSM